MIINQIYIIVAILMSISFLLFNQNKCKNWEIKFHYIMQWIFFFSNVCGLMLININPFAENRIKVIMIIVYTIPIIVYIIKCICYFLNIEDIFLNILLWIGYIVSLFILITCSRHISSEKVLQSQEEIIEYNEIKIKDFLGRSQIGKNYYIVLKRTDGKEVDVNIEARIYRDNVIMKVYPHQEKSYMKIFSTVEKYMNFFGIIYEEEKNKIYEVYLTNDIYK